VRSSLNAYTSRAAAARSAAAHKTSTYEKKNKKKIQTSRAIETQIIRMKLSSRIQSLV
jgi:hypothetical protein